MVPNVRNVRTTTSITHTIAKPTYDWVVSNIILSIPNILIKMGWYQKLGNFHWHFWNGGEKSFFYVTLWYKIWLERIVLPLVPLLVMLELSFLTSGSDSFPTSMSPQLPNPNPNEFEKTMFIVNPLIQPTESLAFSPTKSSNSTGTSTGTGHLPLVLVTRHWYWSLELVLVTGTSHWFNPLTHWVLVLVLVLTVEETVIMNFNQIFRVAEL